MPSIAIMLTKLVRKYAPQKTPVLFNRPCSCGRREDWDDRDRPLPGHVLLGIVQERVLIVYRRWCGGCSQPVKLDLRTDGRVVSFRYDRTLTDEEYALVRKAVLKAYKTPADYTMLVPVVETPSTIPRTTMTSMWVSEQTRNANVALKRAQHSHALCQYNYDKFVHMTTLIKGNPPQTPAQVNAALQKRKDQKSINDFVVIGTGIGISCPGIEVFSMGCDNHPDGTYRLPPFIITGTLRSTPSRGITSITRLDGTAYPHPHARSMCLNEAGGLDIIPNSLGLANSESFQLFWPRDICRAIDLVYDYLSSITPGYTRLCCYDGVKLIKAHAVSKRDSTIGDGVVEKAVNRLRKAAGSVTPRAFDPANRPSTKPPVTP